MIQAAVTVSHGNVQFGGLVTPAQTARFIFWKECGNLSMLLIRGMMTKFKLTNIFGEPNDYILEGKADVKNEDENDN